MSGISRLSAINIATNYPDDVKISVGFDKELKKFAGFIYLMRNGEIHTLIISTKAVFETENDAQNEMLELCDGCVDWFSGDKL